MNRIANLFLLFIVFAGCNFVGGAGKIKGYGYDVPKNVLKKAFDSALTLSPNIQVDDTSLNNEASVYMIILRFTSGSNKYDYYVRFLVVNDTPHRSELGLIYAWENERGGDEGHNSFKGKDGVKQRLIDVFDSVVVYKIDSILQMEHRDEYN